VVLSVGDDGAAAEVSRGPAATNDPALQPQFNDSKVETLRSAAGPPISAGSGQLVVSFKAFGAQGAVLKIENGLPQAMIYDVVLLRPHSQTLVGETTTVCPVRAKTFSVESWGGPVAGVVISNIRRPPHGALNCSGDSGLTVQAAAAPTNVCLGSIGNSPVSVRLRVDPATGERISAQAGWKLRDFSAGALAPWLMMDFPMQHDQVGDRPTGITVLAIASLLPPPT
jgi:hypothetical protein